MSCIGVKTDRIDKIEVNISLVCDTGIRRYLRVTPTYIWVTTEDINKVNVQSNTDWKVE